MNGRLGEWGNDDPRDVIAAFADGEPVDPARLSQALAEAEGREHLIDLLALRSLFGGQAENREPKKTSEVFLRFSQKDLRGLFAAAALVVAGVIGGFIAGQRMMGSPASAPAATAVNVAPQILPVSSPAPAPTRVIRLENGVDWNERVGGH